MSNATNKLLLILVIVLLILLGVLAYWQKFSAEKPYYAVYLLSGDMYFGKIGYFPGFHLSDVWMLQRDPQKPEALPNLVPFSGVFWGPGEKLYIERDKILWKSRLSETSPVLQLIKNPQARQQMMQQQMPPQASGQSAPSQPPQ